MSKATELNVKSWAAGYVDGDNIGMSQSDYLDQLTASSICKMIDKIGKQVTVRGEFKDEFDELNGDALTLGKGIEEFYRGMVVAHAVNGVVEKVPFADAAYSVPFASQQMGLFNKLDEYEQACASMEAAATLIDSTLTCLADSKAYSRRMTKIELLKAAVDKAVAASNVIETAKPVDTNSGEQFILEVKKAIEKARRPHTGGLSGELIGGTKDLIIYVEEAIMPVISTQVLAGTVNPGELGLGIEVRPVEELHTTTNGTAYAMLVDKRAIKLHPAFEGVMTRPSEDDDGNIGYQTIAQWRDTGYVSNFAEIVVFQPKANA